MVMNSSGLLCLGQFLFLSFLKDSFSGKSPLAGRLFSPSTLSVSMEEARLLMVAGDPMRRRSFSRDASPHHAGGLKVSSPPLAKYFLGFFFHGICASCNLKYHLN